MTMGSIVASVLMMAGAPVLASDASADRPAEAKPAPTCTCPCVGRRHEAKESKSKESKTQSQPEVDYGETASWPSN